MIDIIHISIINLLTNPVLIIFVKDSNASHGVGWKRTDLEFFK